MLELHRNRAPLDLIQWTHQPSERAAQYPDVDPEYPPERRVDTSQPDTTVANLPLRLGEQLGFGKAGVVFEALVLDEEYRRRLPPLVAKVCRYGARGYMARESWYYDELWPQHGIAVARYYGWFEAEIDGSVDIWGPNALNITTTRPLNPFPPSVDPEEHDIDDFESAGAAELPEPWGKKLAELTAIHSKVSILLVERLEALPLTKKSDDPLRYVGVVIEKKKSVTLLLLFHSDNVYLMPHELAPFRVFIADLCIQHIRAANHYSDALKKTLETSRNSTLLKNHYEFPETISPISGQVLNWRLIDLAGGAKTKAHEITVQRQIREILGNIVKTLPGTFRFLPWVGLLYLSESLIPNSH